MAAWKGILVFCLVGVQGGCVMKGKHDEVVAAYAAEQQARAAEGEAARQREQELSAALAEEEAEAERLRARVEELEKKLVDQFKDKASLERSVADMQLALADLDRRKAQAEARIADYRDLLARFQRLIDSGKLKVKIVDGRMVVELATDVLFASGSASLSSDGKVAIVEVAKVLAEIPDRRYQVEGHTDNVPIATQQFPSNWELASARALTVVRAAVDAGLAPDRISAAAYGDHRPVAPNDTTEGKAANRRIEIVVVPDLTDLPGFEELSRLSGQ